MPIPLHELSRAKEALQLVNDPAMTPEDTIASICDTYGVTLEDVKGKSRGPGLSRARHAIFYALHAKYGLGWSDIARRLDKDHSTVLNAYHRLDEAFEMHGMGMAWETPVANGNRPMSLEDTLAERDSWLESMQPMGEMIRRKAANQVRDYLRRHGIPIDAARLSPDGLYTKVAVRVGELYDAALRYYRKHYGEEQAE